MVSFPSRSVSGNARYCELRRPWRQARSCNVAAASYIKLKNSLARGGAPAPPGPPPWIRHWPRSQSHAQLSVACSTVKRRKAGGGTGYQASIAVHKQYMIVDTRPLFPLHAWPGNKLPPPPPPPPPPPSSQEIVKGLVHQQHDSARTQVSLHGLYRLPEFLVQ